MGNAGENLRRGAGRLGQPISGTVITAIAVRGLEVTTDVLYNLITEIEALRREIDELKARIAAIEARIGWKAEEPDDR